MNALSASSFFQVDPAELEQTSKAFDQYVNDVTYIKNHKPSLEGEATSFKVPKVTSAANGFVDAWMYGLSHLQSDASTLQKWLNEAAGTYGKTENAIRSAGSQFAGEVGQLGGALNAFVSGVAAGAGMSDPTIPDFADGVPEGVTTSGQESQQLDQVVAIDNSSGGAAESSAESAVVSGYAGNQIPEGVTGSSTEADQIDQVVESDVSTGGADEGEVESAVKSGYSGDREAEAVSTADTESANVDQAVSADGGGNPPPAGPIQVGAPPLEQPIDRPVALTMEGK